MDVPIKRSSWSIRFEVRVQSVALPDMIMTKDSDGLSRLNQFAAHLAIL